MKTKLLAILAFPALLALLLGGCSVDDPAHPASLQAPPVFANYVAVGNSLTAGYMDSGLMEVGQANSYPRLIANQLGFDNSGFTQPWVADPGIGSTSTGDPAIIAGVLYFNGSAPAIKGTTPAAAVPGLLRAAGQPTPYHNLGVPGATLYDLFNGYNSVASQSHSPFFDFINRANPALVDLYGNEERTATVFDLDGETPVEVTYQTASTGWQAIAKGPSLLTVWIGNNDVLGGATGGNPTQLNMTPPQTFASMFSSMMQLLAGGLVQRTGFPATIAVANIPNVTDVAYFLTEAQFNLLLAARTNGALTSWPGGYAEGVPQFITFPVLSWVAENLGDTGTPIPSNYTLTTDEVDLVGLYVGGYNQAIAQVVAGINAAGLAKVGLVDANAVMAGLTAEQKTHFMVRLVQLGGDVQAAAASTIFSLDGVHPNNHGYGVVANAFLDVINALAETEVPAVDAGALVWDPTYGMPAPAKAAAFGDLSPEAADAMGAIWR